MCVIDETIAFMGGIDMCFGRWDTPQHSLVDEGEDGPEGGQIWVGKDYSNPRVLDFHTLNRPEQDMYDRSKVARMPWCVYRNFLYWLSVLTHSGMMSAYKLLANQLAISVGTSFNGKRIRQLRRTPRLKYYRWNFLLRVKVRAYCWCDDRDPETVVEPLSKDAIHRPTTGFQAGRAYSTRIDRHLRDADMPLDWSMVTWYHGSR
jgi:hypothetical protein